MVHRLLAVAIGALDSYPDLLNKVKTQVGVSSSLILDSFQNAANSRAKARAHFRRVISKEGKRRSEVRKWWVARLDGARYVNYCFRLKGLQIE